MQQHMGIQCPVGLYSLVYMKLDTLLNTYNILVHVFEEENLNEFLLWKSWKRLYVQTHGVTTPTYRTF